MHKGDDQAQSKESLSSATPSVFNLDDVLKPSDTFDFLNVKTTEKVDTTATATEPTTQQGEKNRVLLGTHASGLTGYIVDVAEKEEVDELLPQQAPRPTVESMPKLKTVNETHRRREWAHEINVNQPFDNFHDLVPEMAKEVC